jgi:hypothetical protein
VDPYELGGVQSPLSMLLREVGDIDITVEEVYLRGRLDWATEAKGIARSEEEEEDGEVELERWRLALELEPDPCACRVPDGGFGDDDCISLEGAVPEARLDVPLDMSTDHFLERLLVRCRAMLSRDGDYRKGEPRGSLRRGIDRTYLR